MDIVHGKPIDIAKLKSPVLSGLKDHLDRMTSIADYLVAHESAVPQSTCYICDSFEAVPFAEIHGFSYVQCAACTHVYTSTRYPEAAIERFYKENTYWSQVTYANKETCFYRRENVDRPKADFVEQYVEGGPGTWVDVGAGSGGLVSILCEKGWDATGLELSETSVAFARATFGVELLAQTLSAYAAEHTALAGSVDVVSFIGLIEHVVDPMAHLANAHALLKTGGLLVVQVPNAGSLASMIQTVFPENVFRHMSPIEHVMLFTRNSLETALAKSGFEIDALWFHGLDVYELLNNLILCNQRIQGSHLKSVFMEHMNELQMVFDRAELSDRIVCVARKQDQCLTRKSSARREGGMGDANC